MGKTMTPAYRAEYLDQSGWQAIIWNVKGGTNRTAHGAPTDENAEKLRRALNASFQPGGTNWHVSQATGIVPHVRALRVVHQASGHTVATATAPAFEIC